MEATHLERAVVAITLTAFILPSHSSITLDNEPDADDPSSLPDPCLNIHLLRKM